MFESLQLLSISLLKPHRKSNRETFRAKFSSRLDSRRIFFNKEILIKLHQQIQYFLNFLQLAKLTVIRSLRSPWCQEAGMDQDGLVYSRFHWGNYSNISVMLIKCLLRKAFPLEHALFKKHSLMRLFRQITCKKCLLEMHRYETF